MDHEKCRQEIHVSMFLAIMSFVGLLFDYHKKRSTTGNDHNGVIISCLLITFDYDLQDVTEMLYSSLIPSSLDPLANE